MKFENVDKSEALDGYVQEHANSLLKRLNARGNRYKIKMIVKSSGRTEEAKIKEFVVIGTITVVGQKQLRASKKHKNPQDAVLLVIGALEKQLRRLTEKKERSRSTMGKTLKPVNKYKWEVTSHF